MEAAAGAVEDQHVRLGIRCLLWRHGLDAWMRDMLGEGRGAALHLVTIHQDDGSPVLSPPERQQRGSRRLAAAALPGR